MSSVRNNKKDCLAEVKPLPSSASRKFYLFIDRMLVENLLTLVHHGKLYEHTDSLLQSDIVKNFHKFLIRILQEKESLSWKRSKINFFVSAFISNLTTKNPIFRYELFDELFELIKNIEAPEKNGYVTPSEFQDLLSNISQKELLMVLTLPLPFYSSKNKTHTDQSILEFVINENLRNSEHMFRCFPKDSIFELLTTPCVSDSGKGRNALWLATESENSEIINFLFNGCVHFLNEKQFEQILFSTCLVEGHPFFGKTLLEMAIIKDYKPILETIKYELVAIKEKAIENKIYVEKEGDFLVCTFSPGFDSDQMSESITNDEFKKQTKQDIPRLVTPDSMEPFLPDIIKFTSFLRTAPTAWKSIVDTQAIILMKKLKNLINAYTVFPTSLQSLILTYAYVYEQMNDPFPTKNSIEEKRRGPSSSLKGMTIFSNPPVLTSTQNKEDNPLKRKRV